ncbi:hypothetical protein [Psychrobacillus lasiicapitis]|uniref:Uncharacterized protein n=1 Tax=Psychrobacillus lasiicapitis TaxID=1636719 RepID=A0A544SV75_9BACI|nr:hypothetical protein [Psychrobacillus lasiicapitis]TQR09120.1 hypothetical protein FG382_20195 [Psychrobacillus lasiicapitis]GGA47679.1 hypothetical protein GCM10011384_41720 [Psychrobacillus lasiicapitis]
MERLVEILRRLVVKGYPFQWNTLRKRIFWLDFPRELSLVGILEQLVGKMESLVGILRHLVVKGKLIQYDSMRKRIFWLDFSRELSLVGILERLVGILRHLVLKGIFSTKIAED